MKVSRALALLLIVGLALCGCAAPTAARSEKDSCVDGVCTRVVTEGDCTTTTVTDEATGRVMSTRKACGSTSAGGDDAAAAAERRRASRGRAGGSARACTGDRCAESSIDNDSGDNGDASPSPSPSSNSNRGRNGMSSSSSSSATTASSSGSSTGRNSATVTTRQCTDGVCTERTAADSTDWPGARVAGDADDDIDEVAA